MIDPTQPNSPTPPRSPAGATTEERLVALEQRLAQPQADAGYVRVPKWAAHLALAVVVMALVLALFTLPTSPFAQSPTPTPVAVSAAPAQAFVPQTPVPLDVTSATRTLGDPNAKIALVEYGDFQ